MTNEVFVTGWQRLCAAFDVKKSNEHMKIVWENVRSWDNKVWPIAVESMIKDELAFPRIATIRQYLFDIGSKFKKQEVAEAEENSDKYIKIPPTMLPRLTEIIRTPSDAPGRRALQDKFLADVDAFWKGNEIGLENMQI